MKKFTESTDQRRTKRRQKKDEFITVRVSSSIKEKLEEIADKKSRSLSWLVNNILVKFVGDIENKAR